MSTLKNEIKSGITKTDQRAETPTGDDAVLLSRRKVLGGAVLAAGGLAAPSLAKAAEVNPDNLPPNVPEWTPYLG